MRNGLVVSYPDDTLLFIRQFVNAKSLKWSPSKVVCLNHFPLDYRRLAHKWLTDNAEGRWLTYSGRFFIMETEHDASIFFLIWGSHDDEANS